MATTPDPDLPHMLLACRLAQRAKGYAEPNPTVGCVIAIDDKVIADGWTQEFGSDHAEVHAIGRIAATDLPRIGKATMYVTLEPCCHEGKTPPCTEAILASGIRRICVAVEDPFPAVAGKGIQRLREAGLDVTVGLGSAQAGELILPYLKLQREHRPWVIAKWAMTLDGKIAANSGDSKWISSAASREVVHRMRGQVDAVMIGIGTALADDPLLTARPPGPRKALRIVVDSRARLPSGSQLARTAKEHPVLLAVGPLARPERVDELKRLGIEIFQAAPKSKSSRLEHLLDELGKRRLTNLLVEGGEKLLGSFFELKEIDEVHAFIAPKLVGGLESPSPLRAGGIERMSDAMELRQPVWHQLGKDIYVKGRTVQ